MFQSVQKGSRMTPPSAASPFESRYVEVLGSRMHYVEQGEGDPILLIHGNPTSSYLWRNVIPHVAEHGRAIALDLIGMGKSDKPDIDYRFFDHLDYVTGFVEALNLENVTLVIHDWGGGLGFSYARRHPDNIAGIAFMECVLMPMEWSDADPVTRFMFKRMRDPQKGERMNQQKSFFLKRLMPMMTKRRLTADERARYAEPFPTPESRKPIAVWPREIPLSGEPADMAREIGDNYSWFRTASMPKLFLHASPGVIFTKKTVAKVESEIEGLQSVSVGKGKHYIQEDEPDAIGMALGAWLAQTVRLP